MAEITNLAPMSPVLQGSKGYEAVFVVSFLFLFLIALVAQLLFLRWRSWFPGAESEKSLIKGVRAGVYTFMSYLN